MTLAWTRDLGAWDLIPAIAHYGMGLLVSGPWLLQSPLFGGYSASIGMLPERGISIAVAATRRRPTGWTPLVFYARLDTSLRSPAWKP